MAKKVRKVAAALMRNHKIIINDNVLSKGIGKPSVFHALVVIFLEYFAWGLLMMPLMSNLLRIFPGRMLFMNGIIMGVKGFLSFFSAPLIGALSDMWGRKFFLIITVFATCVPIPFLAIDTCWCFALTSLSGIFSVTFSIVFAYVADITDERDRSAAYGVVSAAFAASFVISPALGAYLLESYSETFVVAVSTAIAIFDLLFILIAVPESLPQRLLPTSLKAHFSWEQADPFALLRKVDQTVLIVCATVVFSFIPEAGVYSCIFIYIRYVVGFSLTRVTIYSAMLGVLAVLFQNLIGVIVNVIGPKKTVLLGLLCELLHLLCFSFACCDWMIWVAGVLASFSTITYPAISAYVSMHSDGDKQGLLQGIVMGIRSLCNGVGPTLFGLFFYLSNVDLDEIEMARHEGGSLNSDLDLRSTNLKMNPIKGRAFLFGSSLALFALVFASFIPDTMKLRTSRGYNSTTNLMVDAKEDTQRRKKNENLSTPVSL